MENDSPFILWVSQRIGRILHTILVVTFLKRTLTTGVCEEEGETDY